ncbi:collagen-like protein [Nocardioides caeni]|uniref:Collagen-like protein n=1 Tax=Nocardioides caeni TaxID=574700 RepID=A0A4S8N0X4_9ACTN|nr:collagen-like protein [Nocardioides caeni]THV09430.1 collagen-like protein [Nocardioides caeni]
MRIRKPTPAFAVAVGALVVSLGGTSYAALAITSADIQDGAVRSSDIRNDSIRSRDVANDNLRSIDIKNGTLRRVDLADGVLAGQRGQRGARGPQGPEGPQGAPGADGTDGADGAPARWVLINAAGQIEAQSGGFTVAAAYPTLANTAQSGDNSLRAAGNVYINAGEDLSDNAVIATIVLQNQTDQNADGITNGRAAGPDANPEFSGEISASVCGIAGVVACAPADTNNASHFVVSPRNSDGSVTQDGARKRFYVVIAGG